MEVRKKLKLMVKNWIIFSLISRMKHVCSLYYSVQHCTCSPKHYKEIWKENSNHKDQKLSSKILSAGNVIFKTENPKNLQNKTRLVSENRKSQYTRLHGK